MHHRCALKTFLRVHDRQWEVALPRFPDEETSSQGGAVIRPRAPSRRGRTELGTLFLVSWSAPLTGYPSPGLLCGAVSRQRLAPGAKPAVPGGWDSGCGSGYSVRLTQTPSPRRLMTSTCELQPG